MPFVGRQRELALLREPNWRDTALLVALYGRRRVGKTRLVEEAYRECVVWKFEGIENAKSSLQIEYFLEQLTLYTGRKTLHAGNWRDCFRLLEDCIQAFSQKEPGRRLIVFFDEFQWMCSMRSTLVSEFKYFWDNAFKRFVDATFVICGSISSFIVKKVVQSKTLYGRVDLEISLLPLSPLETKQFFSNSRPDDDLLQTQMILGGIPQYLSELHPGRSLVQNLNELAFRSHGFFFQEFDRLFISHFSKNPSYKKILSLLAGRPCSGTEIAKALKCSTGGTFSNLLDELILAGFVEKYHPVGKRRNSRLLRYRLVDEYLHFYFSLIEPNAPQILSGSLQYTHLHSKRSFDQWLGYAFERFCRKNAAKLAEILRFSGIAYEHGSWFRRSDADPGIQIDLMFKRADKMLTVCELKYTQKMQTKKWAGQLEAKKIAMQNAFPGYGVETVLIIGKGQVTESTRRWFDHVIHADELVG